MEHHVPCCLTAVSNVQILPRKVPSVQFVYVFQATSRPQLQRAQFQYLEEILFLVAVFKRALDKNHHYNSCIAYASVGGQHLLRRPKKEEGKKEKRKRIKGN
jgi:hypothetical protein